VLALEATALAHGRLAAEDARNRSQSLFGADTAAEAAPTCEIHLADLDGLTAARLFVLSGLCDSKNAARRLIDQGGAYVDGVKVASPDEPFDRATMQRGPLLKAGKKRFTRIVLATD
jgi:tyrosyl-tRNA synthetase